jgi:hypothetical protein
MKALTVFLPCIWNPAKTWVVTRTSQGKYYINQQINGKMFYPKFRQTRKYSVSEATCRTIPELNELFGA